MQLQINIQRMSNGYQKFFEGFCSFFQRFNGILFLETSLFQHVSAVGKVRRLTRMTKMQKRRRPTIR